jgi:hypothetical protein
MESVLTWLLPLIQQYSEQYPVIMVVIFWIGVSRFFMKPVMTIVGKIIELTPSTRDDEVWFKMIDSKVYKSICFILDWFISIKLPQKK